MLTAGSKHLIFHMHIDTGSADAETQRIPSIKKLTEPQSKNSFAQVRGSAKSRGPWPGCEHFPFYAGLLADDANAQEKGG